MDFRSHTHAHTNGLAYVRTDERGLFTTNNWDNLQRLAKVACPDGASVT